MAQPEKPAAANEGTRRAGVEGRKQKRYRCREQQLVRVAVKPTFHSFSALVHDVSSNGIGFLLQTPMEIGTVLALQLKGGQPGTSLVRTAKVVHVRRHLPVKNAPWSRKKPFLKVLLSYLSPGQSEQGAEQEFVWLVGCRISPPLTREELEGFAGPAGD